MLMLASTAFSQEGEETDLAYLNSQPIPPSPTAASLGEFGAHPVNASNGLPSINVPLLEVRGSQISVPISLGYHGGGQKVTSTASWVGLGWSLNAGGVITRTVLGNDDLGPKGIKQMYTAGLSLDGATFDPYNIPSDRLLLNQLLTGGYTANPDMFSFNFMGYSGQFYIDPTTTIPEVHFFSYQDLDFEIVMGLNAQSISDIVKFIVKDGSGTIYEFADAEFTKQVAVGCSPNASGTGLDFNSSWQLSKISTPTEEINFNYAVDHITYEINKMLSESKTAEIAGSCSGGGSCESWSTLIIDTKRLTSIVGPFGTAVFTANKSRTGHDLHQGKALETIDYLDKQVVLTTSFSSTDRLKLQEVAIISEEQPQEYVFGYKALDLPQAGTYSIDHWGYFNGESNPHLRPVIGTDWPTGANREANPAFSQAGSLHSVTYPTRGRTEFIWENSSKTLTGQPATETVPGTESIVDLGTVSLGDSYSTQFEINVGQTVQVRYEIGTNGENQLAPDDPLGEAGEINFSGIPGIPANVSGDATWTSGQLAPGIYTLNADNPGIPFDNLEIYVDYFNENPLPGGGDQQIVLGGLRIKSIKNYQGTELLNEKNYLYPETSTTNLILPSYYAQIQTSCQMEDLGEGGTQFNGAFCGTISRSSSSVKAVASFNSYERVLEFDGTAITENGYTEYIYYDDPDLGGGSQVGVPIQDQSWKRSILKEKNIYDGTGALLESTQNDYVFTQKHQFFGVGAAYIVSCQDTNNEEVTHNSFPRTSEWARLDKVTKTQHTANGNVSTETTYSYFRPDIHVMPNQVLTTDSRGEQMGTITLYPKDYSTANISFNVLKEDYFARPVAVTKYNATKGLVLSETVNQFNDLGLVESQWRTELASPILVSNWAYSNLSTNPEIYGTFGLNAYHSNDPEVEISYYSNQRLKEVKSRSLSTTYLWGHDDNYVVASIEGASYGEVLTALDLADDNNGQAFVDDLAIQYFPEDVGGKVAELATALEGHLPKAFLTTYVYEPGIGVISKTDPNGHTTRYEYDELGRLFRIRNHLDHVLKQYEYNYKNN